MTILSDAIHRRGGAPVPAPASAPAAVAVPRRRIGAADVAVIGGAVLLAAVGTGAALWRTRGSPASPPPNPPPPPAFQAPLERTAAPTTPSPSIAYAPPVEPASPATAKPASSAPAQPASSAPAQPASSAPAQPASPAPAQPASPAPAHPPTTRPRDGYPGAAGGATPPPRPPSPARVMAPAPEALLLEITPLAGGLGAVFGSVEVLEGGAWRPLRRGEAVRVGSEVRAAPGARATLDLPGASVDLGGGAHVRIARLQRTGDRPEVGLHVSAGEAAIDVREGAAVSVSTSHLSTPLAPGRYRVRAGASTVEPAPPVEPLDATEAAP